MGQVNDCHNQAWARRINERVRGKRGITPETAWLLSQALHTTPEFWINLQATYDLARSRPTREIERLAAAGRAPRRLGRRKPRPTLAPLVKNPCDFSSG